MSTITAAQLILDANADLPDQLLEQISAEDVRERILDLADSVYFKLDAPVVSDLEMSNLTETAARMMSPAQFRKGLRFLEDADQDTKVEVERTADNDTIYLRASTVDIITAQATNVLVGTAATGVNVSIGSDLVTLDGEINLKDFPSARDDGSTTKALYVNATGDLQFGTVTASAGAAIQDADADTILSVEKTADNDTLKLTIGANELLSIAATLYQFGDFNGTNYLQVNQTTGDSILLADDTVALEVNSGSSSTFTLDNSVSLAILGSGLDLRLSAYPSTRDDGNTTKALYVDANGTIQYGTVTGAGSGGDMIEDADGDTKIQVEEGADDDTIRFDALGTEIMTITSSALTATYSSNQRLNLGANVATLGDASNNFEIDTSAGEARIDVEGQNMMILNRTGVTPVPFVKMGDVGAAGSATTLEINDDTQEFVGRFNGQIYFQAGPGSSRIGGPNDSFSVDDTTNIATVRVNSDEMIRLSSTWIRIGDSNAVGNGNFLQINDSTNTTSARANGLDWLSVVASGVSNHRVIIGDDTAGGSYLDIDREGQTVEINNDGSLVLNVNTTASNFGRGNDRLRVVAGEISLQLAGTKYLDIDSASQVLGLAAGPRLNITNGSDTIELDAGVINLPDFTSARDDGSTTKALYVDGSGNLQHGAISGGISISDGDSDTTLSVEKSADNDTLILTIGAAELLSVSSLLYRLGDFAGAGNSTALILDDTTTTGETAKLQANNGVTLESGTNKTLLLDGPNNKLVLATALDLQLVNYPSTRDDGSTTKALYVDGSGNVLYGALNPPIATKIEDDDNDTGVEAERTSDDDILYLKAGGVDLGIFNQPGGSTQVKSSASGTPTIELKAAGIETSFQSKVGFRIGKNGTTHEPEVYLGDPDGSDTSFGLRLRVKEELAEIGDYTGANSGTVLKVDEANTTIEIDAATVKLNDFISASDPTSYAPFMLFVNTTTGAIERKLPAAVHSFPIAVSDMTSDLATGTAKVTFRIPYKFEVTKVTASVATAPTGADLLVDVNDDGSSIFGANKLRIDATEKTSETAATPYNWASGSSATLAADSEITVDIDQVGSTIAGVGLVVCLIGQIVD